MTDHESHRNIGRPRDNEQGDDRRPQYTTADNQLSRTDGQTTLISGISGTTLSYLPGDLVDNAYQLTKLLGRGGMGAVFECKHLALDRVYALKLLSADQLSREAWIRFQAEAQSLARLNHPGIVSIYNMGIDKQQCPFYVMDLIDGEALDSLIARSGPLAVSDALDIFIQVADALSSAHMQGVVHRDIKPSNLMLCTDAQRQRIHVKLVDFGIARISKQGLVQQSQTATGVIFGTPFYMSPEQCGGSKADERSDIYSFGCALFETLTGSPPFVGDSAFHTFMLHQSGPVPNLSSRMPPATASEALEIAVQKMLCKSPEDRYQTMPQVKHDLERIKAGKPILGQAIGNTVPPRSSKIDKTVSRGSAGYLNVQSDNTKDEEETYADNVKPEPQTKQAAAMKWAIIATLVIIFGGSMCAWLVINHESQTKTNHLLKAVFQQPKLTVETTVAPENTDSSDLVSDEAEWPELKDFGATKQEIKSVPFEQMGGLEERRKKAEAKLKALISDSHWNSVMFMRDGYFHFPDNFFIGAISIGGKQAQLARGNIQAPPNEDAFLYLASGTRRCPDLLNKFGPNDLTGIAMVFENEKDSMSAIDKVSKWKRLKDVWLFNPLLKRIVRQTQDWQESIVSDKVLDRLDQFKGLHSVGLCYPLTGSDISRRPFLKSIKALSLCHIRDFDFLLKKLPAFNNIDEIFLMEQDTKDQDLDLLSKMPNLRSLTILRGHLTLDSVKHFEKMKSLKKLRLDRNDWTNDQKKEFQNKLSDCEVTYEKVIDRTYWPMSPEDIVENQRAERESQQN